MSKPASSTSSRTDSETRAYAYDLPPELIAEHPLPDRDASRLLVLRRGDANGLALQDRVFTDLVNLAR